MINLFKLKKNIYGLLNLFIMEFEFLFTERNKHWPFGEWPDMQEHTSELKQMQKQTHKIISNRKEMPFPGMSGERWERTGLWLFSRNKERIGLGCVREASVWRRAQGLAERALVDQRLTQAACLPLTKENPGVATCQPLFWTGWIRKRWRKE